jgi:hypothetical protein
MLREMPSFSKLLARLEKYDTLPGEAALSRALEDCLADPEMSEEATGAGIVLWNNWKQEEGSAHWEALVRWAEQRLDAWHSLKANAVAAAWEADPSGEDVEKIRNAVLISLRQGINDDLTLLADAHFFQGLAKQRHSFAFTQAIRELRHEGVPLPEQDSQLIKHLSICVNAFMYLIV